MEKGEGGDEEDDGEGLEAWGPWAELGILESLSLREGKRRGVESGKKRGEIRERTGLELYRVGFTEL